MHKLTRPTVPNCLSRFKHGRNNWEDVTPADKSEIWQQLDRMQHNRCAYCECGFDVSPKGRKAHIEHFRQRSRYPQGTFKWDNLFGSCDRNESCGKHKDACGNYNHQDLIKMDEEDPDDFFLFVSDGTISILSGLSESDQHRAKETLRIFNLDERHGPLRCMRHSAVQGHIETAEELLGLIGVFDEEEWLSLLEDELKEIATLPFSTAIKHLFLPR